MTLNTFGKPLDKTFDPAQIEAKWYAHWEAEGLFRPHRPDAVPFTLVNPPPNVTGSLHIGHALDNTLQDVMIRYERLRGKDALWVVGTDHAGIATQMVVERQLEAAQDKRTNYSREAFIDKVWQWKAESGGTITRQLRRLGCSMDWSREQFTMDPHFTKAVVKVFVDLYNQGLIYRDKRLVNWDPKLKTAISDLEVETQEVKGHFWHFRYPLADGVKLADGRDHIVVATTRPETMLADMAVAVNAEDPRYQSVIGKEIEQPITGRRIPIVADEHADPELGSGAVKITPGHDFNDFEVGKRAGFKPADMLNMFDAEANVVQTSDGLIPAEFVGLHRFRRDGLDGARELVVERMKALGHLVMFSVTAKDSEVTEKDAEDRVIQTPYGDRGGVVIEPWLTDQWYVDAKTLAQPPIEAVRDGRIEIVPKTWEKTWFNWMENIQPWCVSRQLWWGHRIPAWYGPMRRDGGLILGNERNRVHPFVPEKFVAEAAEVAITLASEFYGAELSDRFKYIKAFDSQSEADAASNADPDLLPIWRDSDVLDTWFSSALWPFATLGWPETSEQNPARPELVEGPSFSSPHTPSSKEQSGASTSSARAGLGAGGDLLARHYPNDLLISGFDILFFWCARMAMQGMHFMGDVPWKRLYLHGLVRAADGQKMSKSKGNVVDPLVLIDLYGADALRFFMASMESQGRDVKMDKARVEGYRNFATKLWNAARFCQSNGIGASSNIAPPTATKPVNSWILGKTIICVAAMDKALAELRFDAAANAIYHFVWGTFCDWYIELIKGQIDDETKAVAGWVLDQILVMLHPFMPFITEELWHAMGTRGRDLIDSLWLSTWQPIDNRTLNFGPYNFDHQSSEHIDWAIDVIGAVRTAKNELGIAPGARLTAYVTDNAPVVGQYLAENASALKTVARLDVRYPDSVPEGPAMRVAVDKAMLVIPLEGVIDIAAEKARLTKALEVSTKETKSLEGRLNNPSFVEKAKPEAVEKARADHAAHAAEAERLAAALSRLG